MSSDGTSFRDRASHRGTANIISGYASADKFNFVNQHGD